jgi:hypothetical protein
MKKFLNFFRLSFAEKILLGESLFLVALTGLILRIVPFKFLKRSLTARLAAKAEQKPIDWRQINLIARSVRSVSRFVPFATCLSQALAAMLLIKSRGQHSELKIGVAKDEEQHFKAHAWLEANGRIVIGKLPSHREYKVLDTFFG